MGSYSPSGDSPYGCADMVGNVWEWTNTRWEWYPYDQDDGREEENGGENRVVRGGSSFDAPTSLRCTFRMAHGDSTGGHFRPGFRACIAPPLPK